MPRKYLFFRDLTKDGNLQDGKTFHAAGLVHSVNPPSKSGKDYSVIFINPFTGFIESQWRSILEVEVFEVEQYEYETLQGSINLLDNQCQP